MKIAICLSGQPRFIEKGVENFKKSILNYEYIDIFIHTKSYETKEVEFKKEILKITTIKGCLKHYDEWLPILKAQITPENEFYMLDFYNKMQSKADELLKYL